MSDEPKLNLDEIEARAKAATPGPWSWSQYPSGSTSVTIGRGPGDDGVFLYLTRRSDGSEPQKADDAAFIAAANPATVLALVARVRRLQEQLDVAQQLNRDLAAAVVETGE